MVVPRAATLFPADVTEWASGSLSRPFPPVRQLALAQLRVSATPANCRPAARYRQDTRPIQPYLTKVASQRLQAPPHPDATTQMQMEVTPLMTSQFATNDLPFADNHHAARTSAHGVDCLRACVQLRDRNPNGWILVTCDIEN
jgi:hypothetical protein